MDAQMVKEIRKSLRLSQSDFAKKVGVTPRTVQNWEAGNAIPKAMEYAIIALKKEAPAPETPGDNLTMEEHELPRATAKLFRLIQKTTEGNVAKFAAAVGVTTQRVMDNFTKNAEGEYPPLSRSLIREITNIYGVEWLGHGLSDNDELGDPARIGNRILQFLDAKALTPEAFCNYADIDENYLTGITSGEHRIDLNLIYTLEQLGISIRWLLTGKEPMMIDELLNLSLPLKMKPRITFKAAAGELDDVSPSELLARGEQVAEIPSWPPYDFTIIINGDSMMPLFLNGDELACRYVRDTSVMRWGRAYVLATRDGVVFKRVYDAGDKFRCVSYNNEYPEYLIDKKSVFQIALVVGSLRRWD